MILKKTAIEIPADNPFKNDVLERKENALILTDLIESLREPYVMSISAAWGTGKTTFIRMWEQHLASLSYYHIYFNAWENQSDEDPLIAFMAEINDDIVTRLHTKNAKAIQFFEQAKSVAASIARKAIPVAAKIATHGVIDIDAIAEAAIADTVADIIDDEITTYHNRKKTLAEFRKSLESFINELNKHAETPKPLVFFIDELDRCRPTYVIDLLERINHIFNIPGFVFVLALDKEQISHSIRSIYGEKMQVDGYLRRFIDLDYKLPDPSAHNYCAYLCKVLGIEQLFEHKTTFKGDFYQVVPRLVEVFGLSLRTQEQCFARLSIARRGSYIIHEIYLYAALLILLRAANESLYYDFVMHRVTYQAVLDFYDARALKNKGDRTYTADNHIRALYIAMSSNEDELQAALQQNVGLAAGDSSESKIASNMVAYLNRQIEISSYNCLDTLTAKIEILERFGSQ